MARSRPIAALLLSVVGIVLLVACANVANMLLARAATRQREIAVRLAIGASRGRLVRQLLAESLLLSGLGGLMGLLLAGWTNRLLLAYRPEIPIRLTLDLGIDLRVLVFTISLSLLTGLIFGLAPALKASRPDLVSALKETASDRKIAGRFALGNLLVVGQVALSLVLMIGAGLLVRSLSAARAADVGFQPERLGIVTLELEMNGYEDEGGKAFYRQAVERVRSLPGVESATLATRLPFSLNVFNNNIYVDGHELTPDESSPFAVDVTFVGDDYFRTMGIPLLEGRGFRESNTKDSAGVIVVNETLARRFWPDESAIGKHIRTRGLDGPRYEIVGVSRAHQVRTVGEMPRPYLHFARSQSYNPYASILFRTSGEPAVLLEPVRRELLAMDPDLVFLESTSMSDQLAVTLYPVRMGTNLLGGFSFLAILLAAIGLYGLIAYWVSQRTREMGIRIALGAETGRVTGLVLRQGMTLAGIGVVLGLAGAIALSRVLSGVLYTVRPVDPLTFVVSALILLAVALLASAIPAQRAARVDPMVALRYE